MTIYTLLIAGGRDFANYELLKTTVDAYAQTLGEAVQLRIVSGMAKGADLMAVRYAREYSLELIECPADWKKHGRSAGYKRNSEMADIADGLVAFWDRESRGTAHMIRMMREKKKHTFVVQY